MALRRSGRFSSRLARRVQRHSLLTTLFRQPGDAPARAARLAGPAPAYRPGGMVVQARLAAPNTFSPGPAVPSGSAVPNGPLAASDVETYGLRPAAPVQPAAPLSQNLSPAAPLPVARPSAPVMGAPIQAAPTAPAGPRPANTDRGVAAPAAPSPARPSAAPAAPQSPAEDSAWRRLQTIFRRHQQAEETSAPAPSAPAAPAVEAPNVRPDTPLQRAPAPPTSADAPIQRASAASPDSTIGAQTRAAPPDMPAQHAATTPAVGAHSVRPDATVQRTPASPLAPTPAAFPAEAEKEGLSAGQTTTPPSSPSAPDVGADIRSARPGTPAQRAPAAPPGSAVPSGYLSANAERDSQSGSDDTLVAPPRPPAAENAQSLPLESVWPVQRVEQPRSSLVQRAPLAPDSVPALPAAAATSQAELPQIGQQLSNLLETVSPGQPTDSAVELIAPRRPRPASPTPAASLQRQPASPPPAVPSGSCRRKRTPSKAAGPAQVETEIGPLPADLWQLIQEPLPASAPGPLAAPAAAAAGIRPAAPVQRAPAASPNPLATNDGERGRRGSAFFIPSLNPGPARRAQYAAAARASREAPPLRRAGCRTRKACAPAQQPPPRRRSCCRGAYSFCASGRSLAVAGRRKRAHTRARRAGWRRQSRRGRHQPGRTGAARIWRSAPPPGRRTRTPAA
jgi:hypothetical protein